MKRKDYFLIAALILIDQAVKFYIMSAMTLYQSIEVIPNFFYITYVRNSGAAFSILQGQRWLFLLLAVVVCVALIVYINKEKIAGLEKLGLLFVIGGALGNAIDRLLVGTVVDFLDFVIFSYDYPVFNGADIFITIGVAMLVISILFSKKEAH